MNHDPFKINEAILDMWRDLKAGDDYIHRLEIRNAALVKENDKLKEALNKMTNTPAEADGVDVSVNFWTKAGTRLPSSYRTFWMNENKEGRPSV